MTTRPCESAISNLISQISNLRFQISNLRFRIQNPKSKIQNPKSPSRAFSLLEVILALAILAGAVAVFSELSRGALENAGTARDLARAELLCESKLAEIAAGLIWRFVYDGDYGLLAKLWTSFGAAPPQVLADPDWAMTAILVVVVWKYFGFHMILYIAGLQQIDRSLYEAARIDGATAWQTFSRVTVPLLKTMLAEEGQGEVTTP